MTKLMPALMISCLLILIPHSLSAQDFWNVDTLIDPITDEVTEYAAGIGNILNDRSRSSSESKIVLTCTGAERTVQFQLSDYVNFAPSSRTVIARFDKGEPIELAVDLSSDRTWVYIPADMQDEFVEAMREHMRLVIQIEDSTGQLLQVGYLLQGSARAIDRLSCF